MRRRTAPGLLAAAVLLAACGGGSDQADSPLSEDAFAVRASSDLAVGSERLLIGIGGPGGGRLGSPDLAVEFEVFPEDDPEAAQRVPATFMWAIPDVSGLYRATVQFDRPGVWLARVIPSGGAPLEEIPVLVAEAPQTPAVGSPAPASETPTAADLPIRQISTDPDPDPRFYELSLADAVRSGRPTVVVFATPKFCTSAVCGPTLDDVKAVAARYPDVNWVHVEVFTNLDDPDNLQYVPAVAEWNLPSEPWVFVVDAGGDIAARFEGVVSQEELVELLG
ncbi:MAG: hypothetical protein ACE5KX_08125 [Acidimicrobiia bacterium]